MSEMNKENVYTVFRGNENSILKELNAVNGLEISTLIEKQQGIQGEAASYFLPVRGQVAWFRAKINGGRIETEIFAKDEYSAIVKATVFDAEGAILAIAHGSSDNDRDSNFPLLETAESRAIRRALDWAGFGCQLNIQSLDDYANLPLPGAIQISASDIPQMPNEEDDDPSLKPDKPSGSKKVSANQTIVADEIDEDDESKKSSGKAKSSSTTRKGKTDKGSTTKTKSTSQTGDDPGELTPPEAAPNSEERVEEDPAEKQSLEKAEEKVEEPTETQEVAPIQSSFADFGNNSTEPVAVMEEDPTPSAEVNEESLESPSEVLAAKTRETLGTLIASYGEPIVGGYDVVFFNNTTVDAKAYYVNVNGEDTEITNGDLQLALRALTETKLSKTILFPSNSGELKGKNFQEIYKEGGASIIAIKVCATSYVGADTIALAAALIVNNGIENDKSAGDK